MTGSNQNKNKLLSEIIAYIKIEYINQRYL